jgi:hypothetical protein
MNVIIQTEVSRLRILKKELTAPAPETPCEDPL